MKRAFESEPKLHHHYPSSRWSIIRAFWRDVDSETKEARKHFLLPGAHLENDIHSKSYWLSVITEEIGKLCQCVNKLQIANDDSVIEEWEAEGYHRIITSVSLLRRLAENWCKLPNERIK